MSMMTEETIITNVKVSEQMAKARDILKKQVLPKEHLFQERRRKGLLSQELLNALNTDASFDHHRRM